jgi:hypothetical protein
MDSSSPKETTLWPITITTTVLLFGISYAIVSLDIAAIRNKWAERRCEPAVLLTGWLYKQPNDPMDSSEFAIENFSFCMNRLIDSVLMKGMGPIFGMFKQSVGATDKIQSTTNTLRASAQKMTNSSMGLFQSMFERFEWLTTAVQKSMWRFSAAMSRLSGIFTATVFAGLSGIVALDNAKNFIIKVCIIILSVLTAIFILLIFVLFPFVPIILTTIGVITAAGFGASVGGMAETFCVPPGTQVQLADRSWRPVETLQLGDQLADSAEVEGILQADGSHSTFVRIGDCILSAGHLVWDKSKSQWCAAEDHTQAISVTMTFPLVYCLNTSTHTWRVRSPYSSESLLLRDWEELPVAMDTSTNWESDIADFLSIPFHTALETPVRGLLGPETRVYTKNRGSIPITQIRIGDEIRDYFDETLSWTTVRAIIHDCSESVPQKGANKGCWVFSEISNEWSHPTPCGPEQKEGYHIITGSGTFLSEDVGLLRDFTEIGISNLDRFRPTILKKLNSTSLE